MVLYGYILDEDDFEVIPTVNRMFVATEVDGQISKVRFQILPTSVDDGVIYNFIFQKGSNISQNVNSFSFVSDLFYGYEKRQYTSSVYISLRIMAILICK